MTIEKKICLNKLILIFFEQKSEIGLFIGLCYQFGADIP